MFHVESEIIENVKMNTAFTTLLQETSFVLVLKVGGESYMCNV